MYDRKHETNENKHDHSRKRIYWIIKSTRYPMIYTCVSYVWVMCNQGKGEAVNKFQRLTLSRS